MIRRFALSFIGAIALAACGAGALTGAGPPGSAGGATAADAVANVVTDVVTIKGAQAIIIAENAYQGAVAVATPVVESGLLSQDQLLRLRDLNNRGYALLEKGVAGQSLAARAAELLNIAGEIRRIVGRPN